MCGICGCGDKPADTEAARHGDHHRHEYAHAPSLAPTRMVQIEQDILAKNQSYADANRRLFARQGLFAVNLVSSPGSGKTTLLVKTVEALKAEFPIAVIEGDQQTGLDAARIEATGVPAYQINTGKGCHLDAHGVGHAVEHLPPLENGILFIENVGNLVCPAGFDLGEAHKIVMLSTTEGEDKPFKYLDMFFAADLMLLNKLDLLPYVDFSVEVAHEFARRVNPKIGSICLSARTGEGLDHWLDWLRAGAAQARSLAASG